MRQSPCQLIGGPFDGNAARCLTHEEVIYRLDPEHDLFHVYRREGSSDRFRHEQIIDVPEYRSRWQQPR